MEKLCETIKKVSEDAYSWFFPKTIDVPDYVVQTLEFIYPTINWKRVSFHNGWPHVLGFSSKSAITLPDTFWPQRIRIYFKPGRWNPGEHSGLGTIIHEGFHVLQIQDILNGWGLGLARPFILLYLACWAGNRFSYDKHPMEEDAYEVSGRPNSLYDSCYSQMLRFDRSTNSPSPKAEELATFLEIFKSMVQRTSGLAFWKKLADSTPGLMIFLETARMLFRKGWRFRTYIPLRWFMVLISLIGSGTLIIIFSLYYLVWMIIWAVVTIAAWFLKIVIEIIGLILTQILSVATKILCAFKWLTPRST